MYSNIKVCCLFMAEFTVTDVTPGETDVKWATIIVQDANDHDPTFLKTRYTVTIPENQPTDSYVTAVSATDADIYLGKQYSRISFYFLTVYIYLYSNLVITI